MAKSTMDFAQQNTERAVQATNWVCGTWQPFPCGSALDRI
jgi:hypothetical protein